MLAADVSARVVCACPNLALERTQRLARLKPGEVLRTRESHVYAGGKGFNVARAVRRLAGTATVVCLAGGRLGPVALGLARDEGLEVVSVSVDGELRSVAVLVDDDGLVTMVADRGAPLHPGDWERYIAATSAHLQDSASLVCSGSLPDGAPPDAFAQLVSLARGRGVRSVVDSTGPALLATLATEPDLVAPNLHEARAALGLEGAETVSPAPVVDDEQAATDAARRLCEAGARAAIVSAGARGVAVQPGPTKRGAWVSALPARVVCPVGAGDVLVAAVVVGLQSGLDLVGAARRAVAVAAASVETLLPAHFDLARADELGRAA
ncbi:MAG: 1-phosphofructokinase family hexose kinase [Candidatus Dormibacteria bacterium]